MALYPGSFRQRATRLSLNVRADHLIWMMAVIFLCSVVATPSFAQDPVKVDPTHSRVEFEDDQVRVLRMRLGPGEQATTHSHPDAVLVYLTANLEGRMPPAEAEWQPASTHEPENSASASFQALLVELKLAPTQVAAPLAPELAPAAPTMGIRVTRLIENARVTVSKHRLAPMVRGERLHFHLQDTVIVYLRGGYMTGTTGRRGPYGTYDGSYKVRRGQVDVLPANTLHAFANMGNDPIEFVMIQPK